MSQRIRCFGQKHWFITKHRKHHRPPPTFPCLFFETSNLLLRENKSSTFRNFNLLRQYFELSSMMMYSVAQGVFDDETSWALWCNHWSDKCSEQDECNAVRHPTLRKTLNVWTDIRTVEWSSPAVHTPSRFTNFHSTTCWRKLYLFFEHLMCCFLDFNVFDLDKAFDFLRGQKHCEQIPHEFLQNKSKFIFVSKIEDPTAWAYTPTPHVSPIQSTVPTKWPGIQHLFPAPLSFPWSRELLNICDEAECETTDVRDHFAPPGVVSSQRQDAVFLWENGKRNRRCPHSLHLKHAFVRGLEELTETQDCIAWLHAVVQISESYIRQLQCTPHNASLPSHTQSSASLTSWWEICTARRGTITMSDTFWKWLSEPARERACSKLAWTVYRPRKPGHVASERHVVSISQMRDQMSFLVLSAQWLKAQTLLVRCCPCYRWREQLSTTNSSKNTSSCLDPYSSRISSSFPPSCCTLVLPSVLTLQWERCGLHDVFSVTQLRILNACFTCPAVAWFSYSCNHFHLSPTTVAAHFTVSHYWVHVIVIVCDNSALLHQFHNCLMTARGCLYFVITAFFLFSYDLSRCVPNTSATASRASSGTTPRNSAISSPGSSSFSSWPFSTSSSSEFLFSATWIQHHQPACPVFLYFVFSTCVCAIVPMLLRRQGCRTWLFASARMCLVALPSSVGLTCSKVRNTSMHKCAFFTSMKTNFIGRLFDDVWWHPKGHGFRNQELDRLWKRRRSRSPPLCWWPPFDNECQESARLLCFFFGDKRNVRVKSTLFNSAQFVSFVCVHPSHLVHLVRTTLNNQNVTRHLHLAVTSQLFDARSFEQI